MILDSSDEAKRLLRLAVRGQRCQVDARGIVARLCRLPWPASAVLAGIWPLPGEPDLVPAWDALHARGHAIVLPETMPRGEALLFRRWQPDGAMRQGRYGTRHPDGPALMPDIVFVPLLAWDGRLHRLGYGGGYYDRTLAAQPAAAAVGVGFAGQQVAAVPTGPHDVALDAMVTEQGLLLGEGRSFADLVSGRHRRAQRA